MSTLKINLDEFIEALTTNFEILGSAWFLDTQTGALWLECEEFEIDGENDLPQDLHEDPRYQLIYPMDANDAFEIMENFAELQEDEKLAKRLFAILNKPKPFRRFKDAVNENEELSAAWYAFQKSQHQHYAERWCEDHGIAVEWV